MLAGTPIGDSNDGSAALRRVLQEADVIAAEDTRLLRTLLLRLGITTQAHVVSCFEGNEASRIPSLIADMKNGKMAVVATDAGMPTVSDPGYRLVSAAIEAGIPVTAVPGPSAVLTALAISGLPVDRFCFEGFLPCKRGERRRRLAGLESETRTMIFFEAPHRLAEFLSDAATAFGHERRGAICRELTKPHEQVIRGLLSDLLRWAEESARGEITVVIQGAEEVTAGWGEALDQVGLLMASGAKLSTAVAEVAQITGLRRRELYSKALEARSVGQSESGIPQNICDSEE